MLIVRSDHFGFNFFNIFIDNYDKIIVYIKNMEPIKNCHKENKIINTEYSTLKLTE